MSKASSGMSFTRSMLRTLLMTVATLGTLSEAALSPCPEGQFFDLDVRSCQACSMCPKNQIIRVPCSQHSDTVCGPFFEFYEFLQAPRPTLDRDNSDLSEDKEWELDPDSGRHLPDHTPDSADVEHPRRRYPSRGKPTQENHAYGGGDSNMNDFEDLESSHTEDPPAHEAQGVGTPYPGRRQQTQQLPSLQTPGEEENQWKVLALALIIVLCVVCIVLIVFIFFICYLRASRPYAKTAALFGAGNGSGTGNQRPRPSAPHRYVPITPSAQAHTTTSASGGRSHTAATTSGPARAGADDSEGDGGGMQATPSSEYVYFKSPQNGNDAVDV